jgi:hypothetical protein
LASSSGDSQQAVHFCQLDYSTYLGAKGEDGHVTTIRKDDVGQSTNNILQIRVLGPSVPVNLLTILDQDGRILNPCSDDGDE